MKKSTNSPKALPIDYSDIPETTTEFWQDAEILYPSDKKAISIRLDEDVVNWFKSLGKGYQTKINAVLKTYMQQKNKSSHAS